MRITEFALKYRLRIKKDELGDSIIPGRFGESHIFENEDEEGRLGLCVMFLRRGQFPKTFAGVTRRWHRAKAELLAVGMELGQDGDYEGTAVFDGGNAAQAKIAIRIAGVRRKRQMSPERRAQAVAILREHRLKGAGTVVKPPSGEARNASGGTDGLAGQRTAQDELSVSRAEFH